MAMGGIRVRFVARPLEGSLFSKVKAVLSE